MITFFTPRKPFSDVGATLKWVNITLIILLQYHKNYNMRHNLFL